MTEQDKESLKMFVWNGVHTDWTSGIVCILAHSIEEAYEVMKRKEKENVDGNGWWWEVTYNETKDRMPDHIFTSPDGDGVSGGG